MVPNWLDIAALFNTVINYLNVIQRFTTFLEHAQIQTAELSMQLEFSSSVKLEQ